MTTNEFRIINVRRVSARLKQLGYTEEFEYNHKTCIGKAYKIVKGPDGRQSYVGMKLDADKCECVTIDARDSETAKWTPCAEAFKGLPSLEEWRKSRKDDGDDGIVDEDK